MLEVERIGPQHQAGSDSLLTGLTFFKMTEMFFEDAIDDSKYLGHLYGFGTSYVVAATNTNEKGSHVGCMTPTTSDTTDSSSSG